MTAVGENIKSIRKKLGITQEELSEKLNVTRQAVSNWETGKTQPDIETLTRMAEVFGVSVEKLIYGKDYNKESGEIKRTWTWDRFHLSLTYYPERLLMVGVTLATVVSYVNWHSIGWALLHGLLNWGYILYYIIRY